MKDYAVVIYARTEGKSEEEVRGKMWDNVMGLLENSGYIDQVKDIEITEV